MEIRREGKYSTIYLSSLYVLMYMLKNNEKKKFDKEKDKRNYKQVIKKAKKYL